MSNGIPRPSRRRLAAVLLAGASLCLGLAAPAPAAEAPAPAPSPVPPLAPDPQGLWEGAVVIKAGQAEADVTVELARDAEGALVGTLDLPSHGLTFVPVERALQDGSALSFAFSRYSATAKADVRSVFQGEIVADGRRIEGTFLEGDRNRFPFFLERIGEPGSERPSPEGPPLVMLADAGDELVAAFNRDADKLRLLFLVSPTCPVCMMNSRMLQRYVARPIADQRLRFYVVWGPMQDKETLADAEQATATLPDPRATHFWTDDDGVAEAFQAPLGIAGEPAWDTYMIYEPGTKWGEAPPAPAYFMYVEKRLAPELRFNAHTFAQEVRRRLGGG